jgi:type IV pilus assembly protein PilC
MKYSWKSIKNSEFQSGVLDAATKEDAIYELKTKGHIVISIQGDEPEVEAQKSNQDKRIKGKIKDTEILLFTRKLGAMIEAGLAIVPALKMLQTQSESPVLSMLLAQIIDDVNTGVALSKSLEKYPNYFDTVYTSLIKAGEASGRLDTFLKKIAENMEKKIKIIRGVKNALRYPVIVLSIAFGVIVVMMIYVVPVFAEIFQNGGVELPLPTKIVMGISEFCRSMWFVYSILGAITVFQLVKNYIKKNQSLKTKLDRRLLNLPVFGRMIQNSILARFSQVLSNLVSGGVNLIEAMEIARQSIPNRYVQDDLEVIKRAVFSGEPFGQSLRKSRAFTETFCGFVDVGEETGKLNEMFDTISTFYEDEFDTSTQRISQLIEPIMIVLLALVIGFILVSMYMPIFKMGGVASG